MSINYLHNQSPEKPQTVHNKRHHHLFYIYTINETPKIPYGHFTLSSLKRVVSRVGIDELRIFPMPPLPCIEHPKNQREHNRRGDHRQAYINPPAIKSQIRAIIIVYTSEHISKKRAVH